VYGTLNQDSFIKIPPHRNLERPCCAVEVVWGQGLLGMDISLRSTSEMQRYRLIIIGFRCICCYSPDLLLLLKALLPLLALTLLARWLQKAFRSPPQDELPNPQMTKALGVYTFNQKQGLNRYRRIVLAWCVAVVPVVENRRHHRNRCVIIVSLSKIMIRRAARFAGPRLRTTRP
jgi:hypothetical protein